MGEIKHSFTLKKILNKYDSIIIYGAGAVGKCVEAWLIRNRFCNFSFSITGIPERATSEKGTRIYQIDELISERDSAIVLIATLYSFQREISDHLTKLGFKNVVPLDDEMLYAIGLVQIYGYYIEHHKKLYGVIDHICKKIWRNSKCKNILLFESRMDYTDSSRAMSEYVERDLHGNYKLAWIVQHPENFREYKSIRWMRRRNPKFFDVIRLNYYVAHAKYIFLTHPGWMRGGKCGQKIVQLGHGEPFKSSARHDVGMDTRNLYADYVLASSADGAIYRRREYGKAAQEVIIFGPPRNDWLYSGRCAISQYVDYNEIDLVLLCLPTFKNANFSSGAIGRVMSESTVCDKYGIAPVRDESDMERLNTFLKKRKMLLLCKEHFIETKKEHRDYSNVKYLTNEDLEKHAHDMTQILAGADALITDFSSVFMDYLLLDRPIGFFTGHTDAYKRGFAVDEPERYMAGHKITDMDGLLSFIEDVYRGNDIYADDRKMARNLIHKYQDDKNCERLAEFLKM